MKAKISEIKNHWMVQLKIGEGRIVHEIVEKLMHSV